MATYEELSKFLDDYNPNRQPVLQQEDAYNQMVRERFGPPDKESLDKEWNQNRTSIGKGTYNPENTERHIINSLEHYYSMGIIVFLVALISCNFKTALKAFFGWCVFWTILVIAFFAVGETGKTIIIIGYGIFMLGGFILYVLDRR